MLGNLHVRFGGGSEETQFGWAPCFYLTGTRARGAGEPYPQEAHVTDADRARLMSNPRHRCEAWPSLRWLRGKGTKLREGLSFPAVPQPEIALRESGSHVGLTSNLASPRPGTPGVRCRKGAYVSTTLATRATPEPVPAPVRVGGLIPNAGTGAERP
jgi:hypothetical protein